MIIYSIYETNFHILKKETFDFRMLNVTVSLFGCLFGYLLSQINIFYYIKTHMQLSMCAIFIYPLVSLSCSFLVSIKSAIPPALIVDIIHTTIELSKLSSICRK